MNVRSLAVLLSVSTSLACAPDRHGDLRTQVVVEQEDGRPRVTYAGVGVGMDVAAAFAALGERPDPVWGGSWLAREQEADFGTRLDVMFTAGLDHVVTTLPLAYVGNPIAIGKVRDRWMDVLGLAGRDCDAGCYRDDGDARVASIRRERGWTGRDELTVTLYR
jgi:hypothetical protein